MMGLEGYSCITSKSFGRTYAAFLLFVLLTVLRGCEMNTAFVGGLVKSRAKCNESSGRCTSPLQGQRGVCHQAKMQPDQGAAELEVTSLAGALCIVTGASSGIGLEVARNLLSREAEVVMACRNTASCLEARSRLVPSDKAHCVQLDLTDKASIDSFVAKLQELQLLPAGQQDRRIILVNNAGVMGTPATKQDDGHLWANHYGHFHLTQLLLPFCGPLSCIIIVASRAHFQGQLRFHPSGELDPDVGGGHWYMRYARSKLCNVLFAAELRRRLKAAGNTNVAVFAISPGRVNTNIFQRLRGPAAAPIRWLAKLAFKSPQKGAETVVRPLDTAARSDAAGLGGGAADMLEDLYWHCGTPIPPSKAALDAKLATALWADSERVLSSDAV